MDITTRVLTKVYKDIARFLYGIFILTQVLNYNKVQYLDADAEQVIQQIVFSDPSSLDPTFVSSPQYQQSENQTISNNLKRTFNIIYVQNTKQIDITNYKYFDEIVNNTPQQYIISNLGVEIKYSVLRAFEKKGRFNIIFKQEDFNRDVPEFEELEYDTLAIHVAGVVAMSPTASADPAPQPSPEPIKIEIREKKKSKKSITANCM